MPLTRSRRPPTPGEDLIGTINSRHVRLKQLAWRDSPDRKTAKSRGPIAHADVLPPPASPWLEFPTQNESYTEYPHGKLPRLAPSVILDSLPRPYRCVS